MEIRSVSLGSFSRIAVTAGLCVLILFVAMGWNAVTFLHHDDIVASATATSSPVSQKTETDSELDQSLLEGLGIATTSKYDLTQIAPAIEGELLGGYASLKAQGNYTPENVQAFTDQIAPTLKADVAYREYTADDIQIDSDTSYQRMMQYRKDLGDALKPLMNNKDSEIEIYAHYIDSKDPKYLNALKSAAINYDAAIASAQAVRVPSDAVAYHIAILNAIGQFSSTLKALADNGNDPFAAAALLRTYNAAEENMYTSFNALAMYYKHKAV